MMLVLLQEKLAVWSLCVASCFQHYIKCHHTIINETDGWINMQLEKYFKEKHFGIQVKDNSNDMISKKICHIIWWWKHIVCSNFRKKMLQNSVGNTARFINKFTFLESNQWSINIYIDIYVFILTITQRNFKTNRIAGESECRIQKYLIPLPLSQYNIYNRNRN